MFSLNSTVLVFVKILLNIVKYYRDMLGCATYMGLWGYLTLGRSWLDLMVSGRVVVSPG